MQHEIPPTPGLSYQGIHNLKWGIVPVGKLLDQFSTISLDEQTQQGLADAKETLHNEGLFILDGHRSVLDILTVASTMAKNLNLSHFAGPAAGFMVHRTLTRGFFKALYQVPGVEICEVYRKEERGENKGGKNFTDKSGLNPEEKLEANKHYLERAKQIAKNPGQAVIAAPYGTIHSNSIEKIRKGVIDVLQTECPAIFSLAVFDPKIFKYVIYLSDGIYRFSPNQDPQEIKQTIHQEYKHMLERVSS